jgi:mutator protein MutT
MISVVAAIVEADGRFLVTRRQKNTHLEGLWEFPGGKIEPGESHPDALRREMIEELGVDVDVLDLVLSTTHHYAERSVELHFYRCGLLGTPVPQLGQEMSWIDRAALAALPLPEADAELVGILTSEAPSP